VIRFERDPFKAVEGADAVIADTWLSMHDDVTARDRRHNQLKPYQVTADLMRRRTGCMRRRGSCGGAWGRCEPPGEPQISANCIKQP
jgi:hypothetical protein